MHAVAALCVAMLLGCAGAVDMPLTVLEDAESVNIGAVCLSGSAPGYYMAKSNSTASNNWVLYFKGGGWCWDLQKCKTRANGQGGDITKAPKAYSEKEGPVSDSATNPFAGWNRVLLWYCDGASFTGNADKPATYGGQNIYFRGKRVLDALLTHLKTKQGMDKAEKVVLSGGSAGGLAAFLHADYVRTQLPTTVTDYRVIPVSGFFLLHDTSDDKPTFPNAMKSIYAFQNSSGGVPAKCIAAMAPADQWQCIFAQNAYKYMATRAYIINSALDKYQMSSIFNGPPIDSCAADNFKSCTSDQVKLLNGYEADFLSDAKASAAWLRAGDGAFFHTCLTHVEAQTGAGNNIAVNGVKLQDSVAKWYSSPSSTAASDHTYLPCKMNTAAPHQCNPTCPAGSDWIDDDEMMW